MFGSIVLDVAIGLAFVYLLLSFICSSLVEGIESFAKMRARDLERGVRELLHDQGGAGLTKQVYTHPLLFGLYQGDYDPGRIRRGTMPFGCSLPSYVPSRNFALALLDVVVRGDPRSGAGDAGGTTLSLTAVRESVGRMQNAGVQRALLTAIDTAEGDLARLRRNVEAWYDSTMDRVAGWYKRRTQLILFCLGLLVSVGVNVNTITIALALGENGALREMLVAQAAHFTPRETAAAGASDPFERIQRLGLPLGWAEGWPGPRATLPKGCAPNTWCDPWSTVLAPVGGWLLTAFAVSLGAPFWFDLLNKIMVIRSTVKPHEKSPEEASQDRQRPPSAPR